MVDKDFLGDLLIHWEDNFKQGNEIPVETLCKDCPHLNDEISYAVKALKSTMWLDEKF